MLLATSPSFFVQTSAINELLAHGDNEVHNEASEPHHRSPTHMYIAMFYLTMLVDAGQLCVD